MHKTIQTEMIPLEQPQPEFSYLARMAARKPQVYQVCQQIREFWPLHFDALELGPRGETMKGRIKHTDRWIPINLEDERWLQVQRNDEVTLTIQSWVRYWRHQNRRT